MNTNKRLLIVDDDPAIGELIQDIAHVLGWNTVYSEISSRIMEEIGTHDPTMIILDLMMPDSDGIQTLHVLAEHECKAGIVLLSGADTKVLQTAARVGEEHGLLISAALQKPVAIEALEAILSATDEADWNIEEELKQAIRDRAIDVHYQPKISLANTDIWIVQGVEALARWTHPVRGAVPPGEFIPVAERIGAIEDLTYLVLDKAVAQAARMKAHGHPIDVALNLSPLLLADSDMPDRLAEQVIRHGVECSQIVIEITESAAMDDHASAMANLTRFRLKGFKLSMDDFGTGYSSMVQLYRMPFSELKIDQSFVFDLLKNEEARTIVRSTVDLAHNLNLTVCAEGIETTEMLDFLRDIGCDQAQGYLISKPLPDAELEAFLNDKNVSVNDADVLSFSKPPITS